MKIVMIVYFLKLLVAVTSTLITDLNCFISFTHLFIYLVFIQLDFCMGVEVSLLRRRVRRDWRCLCEVKHFEVEGVK
jgi:hypothetical protein